MKKKTRSEFEKDEIIFRNMTFVIIGLLALYIHSLVYYRVQLGYKPPSVIVLLGRSIYSMILIFYHLLALRVTVGWFPNINIYQKPIVYLVKVTDPYLRFWRGSIPTIFDFDISPWLGFIVLEILMYGFENTPYLYRVIFR